MLDANPALARLLGYAAPHDCVQRPLASLFAVARRRETLLARVADGEARSRRRCGCGGPTARRHGRRSRSGAPAGREVPASSAGNDRGRARSSERRQRPPRAIAPRAREPAELEEMAYVALARPAPAAHPGGAVSSSCSTQESSGRLGERRRARLLEQARESAARLGGAVDAVLRLARIESARTPFTRSISTRSPRAPSPARAGARGDSTAASIAALCPVVQGDEAQLELLLQNLLDNALKFHGAEPPRVRIDCAEEEGFWHLRVEDNGIGVPAKDAERIFAASSSAFTPPPRRPAPASGSRSAGGSSHATAVASGSSRRPGEGSTFHFTLARRPAASPDDPRGPS